MFMHSQMSGGYFADPRFRMVRIPYLGGGVSMYVVLPAPGRPTLTTERPSGVWLATAIARVEKARVMLIMPRFRIEARSELRVSLEAMGVGRAFAADADFSRARSGTEGPVRIGRVLHQVFVEVDEHGTEAAAATGVYLSVQVRASASFVVDQPFLFAIRDDVAREVLFLGHVAEL